MGLRLKAQLLTLFLVLYGLAFLVLGYFNLSLVADDNQLRTFQEAEREALLVIRHCLASTPEITPASVQELAGPGSAGLMQQVEKTPNVRFLELYAVSGQKLFGFGRHDTRFPLHDQAYTWVLEKRETFTRLWVYPSDNDPVGRPLDSLGPFHPGKVGLEVYYPLVSRTGEVCGTLHLSLEAPRGQVRINLVMLGNLMLGAIFLVSSLLAFNLWGEYALNRPLRGLVEAEKRLKQLDNKPPDPEDAFTSNELVAVSRSFNRMVLDLVKYQRELEEKTSRLEQANTKYRVLNEQLEHKVEEKTAEMKEFFSLVSHDLRIPLAAVAGYADLLIKKRVPNRSPEAGSEPPSRPPGGGTNLSEKQEKFVRSIMVANSHAQDLVRNLLDAMRYEFGQPQIVEQEFDLGQLLEEVVSHVEVDRSIQVELPEGPRLVYADRTRIGRVLTNLVGNAVRCCQERVQVTVRDQRDDLEVEVRDWGPGIPAEMRATLFDKFKHHANDGTSSGLGLGLYIVSRILEDHGRKIHVESEAGEGTRFWFALPRAR